MIESSRRKILDTLNSRYLYKRVVRFLMYIHIISLAITSLRQRLNIYGGFVQIATILGLSMTGQHADFSVFHMYL